MNVGIISQYLFERWHVVLIILSDVKIRYWLWVVNYSRVIYNTLQLTDNIVELLDYN